MAGYPLHSHHGVRIIFEIVTSVPLPTQSSACSVAKDVEGKECRLLFHILESLNMLRDMNPGKEASEAPGDVLLSRMAN